MAVRPVSAMTTLRWLTVNERKGAEMLYYAVAFLVIALVAGLLGFTGIAGSAVAIAKILFVVFLVMFVASLIVGLIRRKGP
jgi:uncharacterized membrane protein YtjA (UPF0391 family)